MTPNERELHLERILCQQSIIHINGETVFLRKPSHEERYLSTLIYEEFYELGLYEGVISQENMLELLYRYNIWDKKQEGRYNDIIKTIENLKVSYYEARLRSIDKERIKAKLNEARTIFKDLIKARHQLDYMTLESVATTAKTRFLTGCSLYYDNGEKVWKNPMKDFRKPDNILDKVIFKAGRNILSDEEVRELARTDPWRTVWSCRKGEESLFGIPSADYSPEQKTIVSWSLIYDNIHQSQNCPPDDVIQDDDMIDGWMIIQRKEREKALLKSLGEEIAGGKSGEIFVPAQTREDVEKVHMMNDSAAERLRKERMVALEKRGELDEAQMPSLKRVLE